MASALWDGPLNGREKNLALKKREKAKKIPSYLSGGGVVFLFSKSGPTGAGSRLLPGGSSSVACLLAWGFRLLALGSAEAFQRLIPLPGGLPAVFSFFSIPEFLLKRPDDESPQRDPQKKLQSPDALPSRSFQSRMHRSDEELMGMAVEGSLSAFEVLVERYKVPVFSLCYQMLRNREDAEEASQETFLKAYRARHLFDTSRRFGPWILKIATNTSRDALRKRRSIREYASSDFLAREADHFGGDSKGVLDPSELEAEEVRQVLQSLSEENRLPLVLKYLHGMKNREIAETLDISLTSLKVRLSRGRSILHARLCRRREA